MKSNEVNCMKTHVDRSSAVLACAAIFLLAGMEHAHCGNWAVSNTLDTGPGSLREAVLDANAGDGGTITFPNVTGTITLTSGELVITATNLNIIGPGPATVSISGNQASGVFYVNAGATGSISGLTIQNGALWHKSWVIGAEISRIRWLVVAPIRAGR